MLLGNLLYRNRHCSCTQCLDQRGVLGVDLAYPVDDGWVVLFGMLRQCLDIGRIDLRGLFGAHLRLPGLQKRTPRVN